MAMSLFGFIGLGIMGARMAANLARAGTTCASRTAPRETAEAWAAEHGGTVADSPRAAAEGAAAVITMVVDGPQVEQVLLGEDGAAHGRRAGHALRRHVDDRARRTRAGSARALAERDLRFVDAPVTGSSPKAEDGTLTIMAGGATRTSRAPGPTSRRWAR